MKLLLLSIACVCMLAQSQGQDLFGRFFPNGNSNTRCNRNPCGDNASCQPSGRNSYTCTCDAGYTGNPYVRCTGNSNTRCNRNPCGDNASCQPSGRNSYTCTCDAGYTGDPYVRCTDINECSASPCSQRETCVNTDGSYTCLCSPGYRKRNGVCSDINECARRSPPCSGQETCSNTQGSYTCRCKAGYTRRNGVCRDINECARRSPPCSGQETCSNTQGSYTCRCKAGYTRRNGVCRATPIPRPTQSSTTRSTTRATTRVPSDDNFCKGKNRTWTECVGNPPTRFTTDTCASRPQICTDGTLLGDLFTKNLLQPSMDDAGSSPLGGSDGARTLTVGATSTTSSPNATTTCVVENIYNVRGEVITGSCKRSRKPNAGNRAKRMAPPTQTKRDLLIMMDESFSVGRFRFEKVKRIAAAIVKLLCEDIRVNLQYTRVAVTSFNGRVYFNIRLRSIRSLRYLDNDANRLADYIFTQLFFHGGYNAQRTCLIRALQHAYNTALDSRYGGRRGDPHVEQDIIIISDGCENCVSRYRAQQQIQETTSFFIQQGVHVYVIGIGLTEDCKSVLSLLAQGGRCFHFFYLTEWDYDVDDFIFQLENPPAGICLNVFENPSGQCLSPIG